MSMANIRKTYDVPAKRGARIEFTDSYRHIWRGRIRSARDGRLRVKLEGMRCIVTLHPTWNIRYLPSNA